METKRLAARDEDQDHELDRVDHEGLRQQLDDHHRQCNARHRFMPLPAGC